jgi:hypothetical protein
MELECRPKSQPGMNRHKRPDFFIVGAPKCGTTAMVEYLSKHPDIFMAKKEAHFFGSDLRFGPQFYRRERNAYLQLFDDWNGQSRMGESSVWYLYSTQAAAEIKAFNPRSRIIIMLREPTEMLYSLYHQFRADGNEHLPTFEEALAAQNDRRAGRHITRYTYFNQGLIYHEVARYTEQIRRYFNVFGREQVHVVLYDDFAAKPAITYRNALDFLGVDSIQIRDSFPVINGSNSVKSSILRDIISDPLVRGTAISMGIRLPRPIFTAMQKIESQLKRLNRRPEKRPRLDPDLRASLKREFMPEVERLSELLGCDLTDWSREEPPSQQQVCAMQGCLRPEPAMQLLKQSDAAG